MRLLFQTYFGALCFSKRNGKRTDLLKYQLGFFIFSMQHSVESSGTKWLKQVITTKA